ncbi:unnamed protein product, partial [Ascophyllum nodosum]
MVSPSSRLPFIGCTVWREGRAGECIASKLLTLEDAVVVLAVKSLINGHVNNRYRRRWSHHQDCQMSQAREGVLLKIWPSLCSHSMSTALGPRIVLPSHRCRTNRDLRSPKSP